MQGGSGIRHMVQAQLMQAQQGAFSKAGFFFSNSGAPRPAWEAAIKSGGLFYTPSFGVGAGGGYMMTDVVNAGGDFFEGDTFENGLTHIGGGGPELFGRMPMPRGGSIDSFAVQMRGNGFDAVTIFTVLVNGVLTTQTVSVPAGTNGLFESVGAPVAVSLGDLISWRIDATASSVSSGDEAAAVGVGFGGGATGSGDIIVTDVIGTGITGLSTNEIGLIRLGIQGSFPDDEVRSPLPRGGTITSFVATTTGFAGTNTFTGPVIISIVVNGVVTGKTLTIPAATTGIFVATGADVPVVAGDRISFFLDSTGSGPGVTAVGLGVLLESGAGEGGGIILTDTEGNGGGVAGSVREVGIVEMQGVPPNLPARTPFPRSGSMTSFAVKAGSVNASNTLDGATIITVLLNGVPTTHTVTIPALTNGTFQSVGPAVAVTAGDLFSWRIDTTASTVGFSPLSIGVGVDG